MTARLQMHQAGKTEEAKSDLARLAKIRKEREEAQVKRKAELEGGSCASSCAFMLTNTSNLAKAAEVEAKKQSSSQKRA